MALTRLASESLQKYGEYEALAFEGRRYTNLDQDRSACRLAHVLRRLGVGAGDRVMVMLPNCPEVISSYGAVLKAGGVIVPVIFLLGDKEVAHILADSEAGVVITSSDMLWKVEGQIGVLTHAAPCPTRGWRGRRPHALRRGGSGEGGSPFIAVERGDDDLAVILYTSGTTGVPKGVALSHANLESNARSAAQLSELDRTEWDVAVLPLSHSYGLTLMNAGHLLGSRSALLRWFNPEDVLKTIQEFRAVGMSGVPTMFVYLLNYPDAGRYDTSSMRLWGSGAAPLPVEIVEPFERKFGGKIVEGYGLTEASPVVSAHRLSGTRKLGSVGQPIPGVEVSIQDDDGSGRADGRRGRGVRQGPKRDGGLLQESRGDGAHDPSRLAPHGRHGPGRSDGFLYIVERKKDLIIRGGFNIYPREVEEALYALPGGGGSCRRGRGGPSDGRAGPRLRGLEEWSQRHGRGRDRLL